ncbi:MAG: acetyl-CoA carboxylase biotin carboxyl carrier protein [Arenicella sp.]
MDIRKIKKLIELLEESNLNELEIQEGEESIRLSRGAAIMQAPMMQAPATAAAPQAVAVPAASEAAGGESAAVETDDADSIKSPMVGTFYTAPKPGDPEFVKVGDTVSVGDVLCIVEAMKIFNQIESDKAGKVVSILKNTGDPVEYGEPLFVIQ